MSHKIEKSNWKLVKFWSKLTTLMFNVVISWALAEWPEVEVYLLKKFPAVLVKFAAIFWAGSFSDFLFELWVSDEWGTAVDDAEAVVGGEMAFPVEDESTGSCALLDPTAVEEFEVGNFIFFR